MNANNIALFRQKKVLALLTTNFILMKSNKKIKKFDNL
jgi:hypothetical protein